MKVIFLDVDGVLNSISGSTSKDRITPAIDVEKVALLKTLVAHTGAKLVLSSSWRCGWTASAARRSSILDPKVLEMYLTLCEELGRQGLSLIDETPRLPGMNREREILYWLSCWELDPVEAFVILDDGETGFQLLKSHLVLTTLRDGLQPCHVQAAETILSGGAAQLDSLKY